MTWAFQCDRDTVKVSQRARYPRQRLFSGKLTVQIHTHIRNTALSGRIKWLVNVRQRRKGHTYAHNFVECRVGADAEVRSGDIVAYRRRNQYHWDAELRVLVSCLGKHQRTVVCLHIHVGCTFLQQRTVVTKICIPNLTTWTDHNHSLILI